MYDCAIECEEHFFTNYYMPYMDMYLSPEEIEDFFTEQERGWFQTILSFYHVVPWVKLLKCNVLKFKEHSIVD